MIFLFSVAVLAQPALENTIQQHYPTARVSISENAAGQAQGLFHIYGERLQAQPALPVKAMDLTEDLISVHKTAEKAAEKSAQSAAPSAALTAALQFLEQQKTLLDVDDIVTELQLQRTNRDSFGGTHFRYQRYLQGIRLEEMEVLVHINAENEVVGINGFITPVPVQLEQAVERHLVNGQVLLTTEEAIDAVATDLKLSVEQLNVLTATPLVIIERPYVVWQVDVILKHRLGRYLYRIADSPAREVLHKRMIIQS